MIRQVEKTCADCGLEAVFYVIETRKSYCKDCGTDVILERWHAECEVCKTPLRNYPTKASLDRAIAKHMVEHGG